MAQTATPAKPRKLLVWELGVSLSAAVVYRMDSMPAKLHKDGNDMLERARSLATQLGTTLPPHEALRGAEVDTVKALEYLQNPREHPIARDLLKSDGEANAALFELGALSHLAMMAMTPGSDVAKDFAARLESAALAAKLPRASWGRLVDALRKGAARDAVIDEMVAMLRAVAGACKG
jgi:hypothetical protein